MHDRRRHRALAQIAVIREAELGLARQELALAGVREREAAEAKTRAEARTAAAVDAWCDHLAGPLNPEFASALAAQLVERAGAGEAAAGHAGRMAEALTASTGEWCASEARLRHAEDLLDTSRRVRARDRDERALEAIEDRVALEWSRK